MEIMGKNTLNGKVEEPFYKLIEFSDKNTLSGDVRNLKILAYSKDCRNLHPVKKIKKLDFIKL
jgi:hypothetical protein